MGKHEAGSAKAIGIAIKAKGLQKLRWYCQMCQKQCRDDNGFKCHLTTDGHMRMMAIFSENAHSFMDDFSKQFEAGYMDLLSRRFGARRVNANQVYNEYIQDRHHTHMNSTMWATLSQFVQYLGRLGKVEAEETEDGWMIRYIDKDPEAVRRRELAARREGEVADDEARLQAEIEAQRAAAVAAAEGDEGPVYTGILRPPAAASEGGDGDRIKVALAAPVARRSAVGSDAPPAAAAASASSAPAAAGTRWSSAAASSAAVVEDGEGAVHAGVKRRREEDAPPSSSASSRVMGTLDALLKETEAAKRRAAAVAAPPPPAPPAARDALVQWICKDLVVKLLTKIDGGRYYKQKGVIQSVERVRVAGDATLPVATVKLLDTGAVLQLSQEDLETVIPNPPGRVVLLAGRYRGEDAEMLSINTDAYSVDVRLLTGPDKGRTLRDVEYEHVCRLHAP